MTVMGTCEQSPTSHPLTHGVLRYVCSFLPVSLSPQNKKHTKGGGSRAQWHNPIILYLGDGARGSGVQSQPWLHREYDEATLGYMNPCIREKKI